MVTLGNGLTVTATVSVLTQVAELVPVVIYEMPDDGETVNEAPVPMLTDGLVNVAQLQVAAPVAVSVVLAPAHIAAGVAVACTTGNGFTINDTLSAEVQPLSVVVT